MLTPRHIDLLADTIGQIDNKIRRDAEILVWLPILRSHPNFDEKSFRVAVLNAVVEHIKG